MSESSEFVSRAVGFAAPAEYVAEITKEVYGGEIVVVKAYGETPGYALAMARHAAAGKLSGRKLRSGFYPGGFEFRPASYSPAPFPIGFA